eukprot:Blabericola_migrator_1__7590@NODE_387_length_9104_cov_64_864336_g310_i0_p3_GENE_NODE_387_length_9104_cov_64_864336_g310_i0NODE_387_length_9104_cov_64_864336_g310_i0_p3_ORF_typecomplete_len366_score68_06PDCD2_C/PF04194_13/28PDCD2_C/PF04194_13/6_1e29DUF1963/PF09234_10/0_0067WYL/PF13280_6/0_093zfRRN7/PF11781_8/2_9e02zfRRN7/PF11781_8/0_43_NODE_387_length_9104_cov_64_864336_g310_i021033200
MTAPLVLGFLGRQKHWKVEKPFASLLTRVGGFPSIWSEWDVEFSFPPMCRRCGQPLTLLLQLNTSYVEDIQRVLMVFICLANSENPCHTRTQGWRVFRVARWKKFELTAQEETRFAGSTTKGLAALTASSTFEEAMVKAMAALSLSSENERSEISDGQVSLPLEVMEDAAKWLFTGGTTLPVHEVEVEKGDRHLEEGLLDDLTLRTRELVVKFKKESAENDALKEVQKIDKEGRVDTDYENSGDPFAIKLEKRLRMAPEQIIRYSWASKPLWLATPEADSPEADVILGAGSSIPKCGACGARRFFEFQILSTLTTLLEAAHADKPALVPNMLWGICSIYTCANDCWVDENNSFNFIEEVAIVQSV